MTKLPVEWNVEEWIGNCATSITRFPERKGLQDVYVNYATGEVRFKAGENATIDLEELKKASPNWATTWPRRRKALLDPGTEIAGQRPVHRPCCCNISLWAWAFMGCIFCTIPGFNSWFVSPPSCSAPGIWP
ncbi:MAG: hypothetical protein IPJ00_17115 [Saprospirales bacterium]|nr:hypothetical protein [Saprospirales bacterium]